MITLSGIQHFKALRCIFHRSLLKNVRIMASSVSTLTNKNIKKVFITRPDIPKSGFDLLTERFSVSTWTEERPIPREELLKNVEGVDAIFCMLTDQIDKEVLDRAGQNLKVIGTMSVGFDHIDMNEVMARKIKIGYTPDVLTDAVAELSIALLLATSRRLIEARQQVFDGKWTAWAPNWMCGIGLKNSITGIVGFGRIGQEIGRRLKSFRVAKILYSARTPKPEAGEIGATLVEFEELVSVSDFIIVTCALTPKTKGLFNEETFAKMKKNAIFINTSRGGVVDHEALQRALETNRILAAGLDVMTPEPLPPNHPLLKLPNCLILPHIGSATVLARSEMSLLTALNIAAALEDKPMPAQLV